MSPSETLNLPLIPPNDQASPPITGDTLEIKGQISYVLLIN